MSAWWATQKQVESYWYRLEAPCFKATVDRIEKRVDLAWTSLNEYNFQAFPLLLWCSPACLQSPSLQRGSV